MRVGVNGAAGQMGRTVCAAVEADSDLILAAAVDRIASGAAPGKNVALSAEVQAFVDADCDVVVDFTVAAAARGTLPWLATQGIHAVVGTTGFSDEDLALFEASFGSEPSSNCLIAPNFAISAVLMMRFAEIAAPWFDTAEVIELHHARKIDAPSGTAVKTIERNGRRARHRLCIGLDREHEVYPGARGRSGVPAISGPMPCECRAWSPIRK